MALAGALVVLPTSPNPCCCSLSKPGRRLLSSLDKARGDSSATHRLLRNFFFTSSKPLLLNTFTHFLSNHHWDFALPMYGKIVESPWYKWNPKLAADLIALLEKYERFDEAESISSESVKKLRFCDLSVFYCNLIYSYSKHGLKQRVLDSYASLKQISRGFSDRRAYESIINGLSLLNEPHDAEKLLEEMEMNGFRPSSFEFRCVLLAYGRAGLFSEMKRVIELMENSGHALDTVSANMVLSSYGSQREFTETVSWLRKMQDSDIAFSIRTYNSVLHSCPTIVMILQEPKLLPLSIDGLFKKLEVSSLLNELLVIQELVSSEILPETVEWSSLDWKLDLHGMHTASAYLILLQWLEKLKSRFRSEEVLPLEVSVVCGLGKHSNVRGESPVKALVSEMMFRMTSPMKLDRLNLGRFVARGEAVRSWLC